MPIPFILVRIHDLDHRPKDWLPEITVENLHVGEAIVSLRFYRKENGLSDYEVKDIKVSLHVIHQPSPWSLTATFAERLKDLMLSII